MASGRRARVAGGGWHQDGGEGRGAGGRAIELLDELMESGRPVC